MKKFNKVLSLLLAFAMTLTLLPASALAVVNEPTAETNGNYVNGIPAGDRNLLDSLHENYPEQAPDGDVIVSETDGVIITEDKNPSVTLDKGGAADMLVAAHKQDEIVRVIVVLEGAPLLDQGFSTAEIAANGSKVRAQVDIMRAMQDTLVADINALVQSVMPTTYTGKNETKIEAKYNYSIAMNGVAVEIPYGIIDEIKQLDNVATAYVAPQYNVPEDMTNSGTASPNMVTTQKLAGSALAWDAGFTGAGMRIAVIDTGLDIDHPSFVGDVPLTETSLTLEEIEGVLTYLNAYKRYAGLTAKALYNSVKVPYRFNYVDSDLDVTHDNDTSGDHGTHVAGIASANKLEGVDVVGVAPEAQLLAMKVFGKNGGAYWDDIVAAIEDCFWLNVDAINMSLGSPSGFTWESDELTQQFVEVMARIEKSDMIASVSAGNSYSAGTSNYWYEFLVNNGIASYFPELVPGHNQTIDPANGVVSSPATFIGATVVASLENNTTAVEVMVAKDENGGEDFVFTFGDNGTYFTIYLGGNGDFQTYEREYVVVPGVGSPEDFAKVDVDGKIALVERGELAFTDKQINAANAGAIGIIVYDNGDSGEIFYMQNAGVIPNVTVIRADGLKLIELAGDDGIGTLLVRYNNVIIADNALAGTMSDFSSWGVTPDLRLVPDITSYGGNIYSTYMDGEYGIMSGTSMSAPHIAGMSALILQYLRGSDYAVLKNDGDYHLLAEALLMSTATPVAEPSGVLYSPRKQGAGNADIYKAITSPVYLTVNGGKPSVSFGDDAEKTGVYTFSFEFNNLTDEKQRYSIDTIVLTDQFHEAFYELTGVKLMGETSRKLDAQVYVDGRTSMQLNYNGDSEISRADVTALLTDLVFNRCAYQAGFDYNGDGVMNTADAQALYNAIIKGENILPEVVVPASGKATVTIEIVLSDADKAYMDANYPNGIYVEGFVRAYAQTEGAVDMSLPFMGFYGDWNQARVFDTYSWYHEGMPLAERYASIMWVDSVNGVAAGGNPYEASLVRFDPDYETEMTVPVVSPNGDGVNDFVDDMYLSLLRNAQAVEFIWTDSEGNELLTRVAEYARQSSYQSGYGQIVPFIYSLWFADIYDFTDDEGNYLPNGSEVTLTINFYQDNGSRPENVEEAIKDREPDDSTSTTIVVDSVYPDMRDVELIYNEKTNERKLKLTVSDDRDVAAVALLTRMGTVVEMFKPSEKNSVVNEDGSFTVEFNVTEMDDEMVLVVGDYGGNERYYSVTFTAGTNHVRPDAFYGYRHLMNYMPGDGYIYLAPDYNGWHSFKSNDATSMMMHTSMYSEGETAVIAADYVDGYIIAIDSENQIFAMKAGDWTRMPLATFEIPYPLSDYVECGPVLDMTYDFKNNVMYVLTDEVYAGDGGVLATIDIFTGAVTVVGKIVMPEGHSGQLLTLAADNDGVLYAISYAAGATAGDPDTGDLYIVDLENAKPAPNRWSAGSVPVKYVGETGYVPDYRQSMTVDHDTNELYWMAYANPYAPIKGTAEPDGPATFFKVDKTTGKLTVVSDVEHNSWMAAVFKPYTKSEDIIPVAELEAITLDKTSISMGTGAVATLSATPYPYYSTLGEIVWTSSDETVAKVVDGIILAVGTGRAVITATCGEVTAECLVDVVSLTADLTFYEWGNNMVWVSMNAGDPQNGTILTDAIAPSSPSNGFMATAYFNGNYYMSESGGNFYRVDPETMQGTLLGSSQTTLFAMTFNYADGFMYAIEQQQISMWESAYNIVRVNLANGEIERVCAFNSSLTPLGGITADENGYFYSIVGDNRFGDMYLMKYVVGMDYLTGEVGMMIDKAWRVDIPTIQNYTSMVYSAEDKGIYVADSVGQLLWIDMASLTPESYQPRIVNLGLMGGADLYPNGSAMNMSLVTIPEKEPTIPEVPVTGVSMPGKYMVLEGGSVSVSASVTPWNAYPEITYAVADTSIATVGSNGVITGVKAGSTTLTVTIDGVSYEREIVVGKSTGYLYGYLLDDFNGGGMAFARVSDTDPAYDIQAFSGDDMFNVFAGAYFDGKLYGFGQDQYGDLGYYYYFFSIDPNTYEMTEIARVAYTMRDMAFDYTTGNLYAIAQGGTLTGAVVQVDLETGELTIIAETGKKFAAMTIDAEGQMYGICEDDYLYAIDKKTGKTEKIGHTGVDAAALYQSMHYDMNTGNVYWSQVAGDQTSGLRLVDLETGATNSLGTITPLGSMVTMLYTIPENEPTVPGVSKEAGITITERTTTHVGGTVELDATILVDVELTAPDASTDGLGSSEGMTITWSSSDNSIATVDANGVVTGVAAGTVTITAKVGAYTDTCEVVITEKPRQYYAYDKSNNQWVVLGDKDFDEKVTVAHKYDENATKLAATQYVLEQDIIFAIDELGTVYSINPDTFVRTIIGDGMGTTYTAHIQEYDYEWNEYYDVAVECELKIVDLDYDNGKLYAVGVATEEDVYWIQQSIIFEIDMVTGEATAIFESEEVRAANLYVTKGRAFMVDAMMSGIINYVDLYSAEQTLVQDVLIKQYWGDPWAGCALFEDELTGVVYAIRDMTDTYGTYDDDFNYTPWDEVTGDSVLYILGLSDGSLERIGEIGNNIVVRGMFIR